VGDTRGRGVIGRVPAGPSGHPRSDRGRVCRTCPSSMESVLLKPKPAPLTATPLHREGQHATPLLTRSWVVQPHQCGTRSSQGPSCGEQAPALKDIVVGLTFSGCGFWQQQLLGFTSPSTLKSHQLWNLSVNPLFRARHRSTQGCSLSSGVSVPPAWVGKSGRIVGIVRRQL